MCPAPALLQLGELDLQNDCTLDWTGGSCPNSCAQWGKQASQAAVSGCS